MNRICIATIMLFSALAIAETQKTIKDASLVLTDKNSANYSVSVLSSPETFSSVTKSSYDFIEMNVATNKSSETTQAITTPGVFDMADSDGLPLKVFQNVSLQLDKISLNYKPGNQCEIRFYVTIYQATVKYIVRRAVVTQFSGYQVDNVISNKGLILKAKLVKKVESEQDALKMIFGGDALPPRPYPANYAKKKHAKLLGQIKKYEEKKFKLMRQSSLHKKVDGRIKILRKELAVCNYYAFGKLEGISLVALKWKPKDIVFSSRRFPSLSRSGIGELIANIESKADILKYLYEATLTGDVLDFSIH